jgi:hypothetical protein
VSPEDIKRLTGAPIKGKDELDEKSTSQAQFRTMAAAAHNPEFAKKVGIKPSVAKEFHGADRKQNYRSLPKKVDEGIMDFMQPQQPKTTKDRLSLAAMRQIEKARFDFLTLSQLIIPHNKKPHQNKSKKHYKR